MFHLAKVSEKSKQHDASLLFNLYTEHIRLDSYGIKTGGEKNNLMHADDSVLFGEIIRITHKIMSTVE